MDEQCYNTLVTAYRPGTRKNYMSKSKKYIRFCLMYGYQAFPAVEWQLVQFARFIANAVTSYDTVAGYMSVIKRLHELGGYAYPTEVFLLKQEMMGIKKELAHIIKKAPPVTPQILMEIFKHVNIKDQMQVVAFAALVVGFQLFLRKSNLVPDTIESFNDKEQLTREDVWCNGKLMMVEIKWSKTLQCRERDLTLPLVEARHKVVCSVFWIRLLIEKFPSAGKNAPLFAYKVNGRLVPLTYDILSKRLKEWVTLTGRQGELYTLHGLRRGGSNHGITVGICGEDLRLLGDWRSDAYLEYLDLTLERRFSNMVKFVQGTDAKVDEWCMKH